ncbi:MAG: NAD-dependent epimerase/dehydratase family protein [Deltaproteobacteria bacterium]|nr:NAD-dependent epimerase/dehydratase family protein [Deltaproteobacteria bacterium]
MAGRRGVSGDRLHVERVGGVGAVRAALTGASGLVGGNLARELVRQGYAVRAIRRSPASTAHLEREPIERVPGDLDDLAALTAAFTDADVDFHCAASVTLDPQPTPAVIRTNVAGTRNVVRRALRRRSWLRARGMLPARRRSRCRYDDARRSSSCPSRGGREAASRAVAGPTGAAGRTRSRHRAIGASTSRCRSHAPRNDSAMAPTASHAWRPGRRSGSSAATATVMG